MMISPRLAGLREWQGRKYPAQWPAIIDADTHERLAKMFADPARRKHVVRAQAHLLSGIATCPKCGGRGLHYRNHEGNGRADQYACVAGPYGCGRTAIKAELLEEYVTGAVLDALESPRVQEALRDADMDPAAPRRAGLLADIQRAQDVRADARRDLADGMIDRADWLDIRQRTEETITKARREYDRLAGSATVMSDIPPSERVRDAWKSWSTDRRRAAIKAVLHRVIINPLPPGAPSSPGGQGQGPGRPPRTRDGDLAAAGRIRLARVAILPHSPIMAEHAAGKSIREIAAAYGHSTQTVRDYVLGRRTPGEPAARDDDFTPFAAYGRRRLADDPHLRAAALLAEITGLGFPGTARTFYRAMERHEIQPHPCPHCHPARISGYVLQPPARQPQPFPLPVPDSPVNGETLASFLGRLTAANQTSLAALLDILPSWFRITTRWHDDRWQHEQLAAWADDAAACLAVVSGSTIAGIKNALAAFGGKRGQPVRAVTACRLCTAARRIRQPVPVHLPACHQVCLRHGIWLSGPGTPQFSVRGCPDILDAERRARRLLRRCTIEQLIYARIQAPADQAEHAWKRRTAALAESNPRSVTETSPQALFQAAAYPDAVAAACASRKSLP